VKRVGGKGQRHKEGNCWEEGEGKIQDPNGRTGGVPPEPELVGGHLCRPSKSTQKNRTKVERTNTPLVTARLSMKVGI